VREKEIKHNKHINETFIEEHWFFNKCFIYIYAITMKYKEHSKDSQNFILIFTKKIHGNKVLYTTTSVYD